MSRFAAFLCFLFLFAPLVYSSSGCSTVGAVVKAAPVVVQLAPAVAKIAPLVEREIAIAKPIIATCQPHIAKAARAIHGGAPGWFIAALEGGDCVLLGIRAEMAAHDLPGRELERMQTVLDWYERGRALAESLLPDSGT